MKAISRLYLERVLTEYLASPKKVMVIEGVRQTGKTTAINQAIASRSAYQVTLTDETLSAIAIRKAATFEDFCTQLEKHLGFKAKPGEILVIDEAQRSEKLYSFILQMERSWRDVAIILSGSVMGAFFKKMETEKSITPAGRIVRHICRPFSFSEFLDYTEQGVLLDTIREATTKKPLPPQIHQRAMQCYFEYLSTGGFPEAIALKDSTEKRYAYIQTLLSFFWQDADRYLTQITGSAHYQYGSLMHATFEAIARHIGDKTQRSTLISTDSPAYRTLLPALLDAMEEWHFLFRLPTQMKTFSTKPGTSSKKYLWDVGIVNFFLNLSRPISANSDPALLSKLLENAVAQELIFYLKDKNRIAAWQSNQKQTRELDFLAHFPEEDIGIEVKASTQTSQKAISQLREWMQLNPKHRGYVVYLGPYTQTPFDNRVIEWIPPYLLGVNLPGAMVDSLSISTF